MTPGAPRGAGPLRVLLLADTHLGLDHALRPRVQRPRRGPDFFANTETALAPAHRGEVDLVVHGGDLLYRSKVPAALVQLAFEPLLRVADRGVPVVVVPGNHERSAIPYPLLVAHRHLHLLDRPQTLSLSVRGLAVEVVGFPCVRNGIRDRFPRLLSQAVTQTTPDVRLLCLHQTVEGAQVGPVGFTFRGDADTLRGRDLPSGFAAVLAGHIHRHQVLTRDLRGRPLAAPVLYPGAIERTSGAERDEEKGALTLTVTPDRARGGRLRQWDFHPLPARPWRDVELHLEGLAPAERDSKLRRILGGLPDNALVRLRLPAPVPAAHRPGLRMGALRSLAGPNQIVEIVGGRRGAPGGASDRSPGARAGA